MTKRRLLFTAVLVLFSVAPVLASTVFSFTGDLRNDATFLSCGTGCTLGAGDSDPNYAQWAAVVRGFTVNTTATMEAITFSYGGGTNGAGQAIAAGGLEPYLSLFDASGNFLASTFFGTTCPASALTFAGHCYDVLMDGGTLAAGNYQIAISAFENMSLAENNGTGTLTDGFTGLGNLAQGEDLHWAFDVILSSETSVPEPNGLGLFGAAVMVLYLLKKGRRVGRRKLRCG